jgi:enamine deaminase RidA (YjgF/YER057c/UK114 family)
MRNSVPTANPWGDIVGYSRAVRVGNMIFVSGTTAAGPEGQALHPDDPGAQTKLILERIEAALVKLGGSLKDVVETRIYVCDIEQWDAIGRAHGMAFADIRPATTMVEVSQLITRDLLVEISATAVVDAATAA